MLIKKYQIKNEKKLDMMMFQPWNKIDSLNMILWIMKDIKEKNSFLDQKWLGVWQKIKDQKFIKEYIRNDH